VIAGGTPAPRRSIGNASGYVPGQNARSRRPRHLYAHQSPETRTAMRAKIVRPGRAGLCGNSGHRGHAGRVAGPGAGPDRIPATQQPSAASQQSSTAPRRPPPPSRQASPAASAPTAPPARPPAPINAEVYRFAESFHTYATVKPPQSGNPPRYPQPPNPAAGPAPAMTEMPGPVGPATGIAYPEIRPSASCRRLCWTRSACPSCSSWPTGGSCRTPSSRCACNSASRPGFAAASSAAMWPCQNT
jgi:hypothetical protein